MVVAVKLNLKGTKGLEVVASAIANAGFESDEPEIIIPVKVARGLGLYPRLPAEVAIEEYRGAGGRRFKAYKLKLGIAKARVVADDREAGPVDVSLTIVPGERDVLLSDRAIDAFGLVLIKPGEGLWKFIDDPLDKVRKSVIKIV